MKFYIEERERQRETERDRETERQRERERDHYNSLTGYWLCRGRSYLSSLIHPCLAQTQRKLSSPGQESNHELTTPGSSRAPAIPLYHDDSEFQGHGWP